MLVQRLWLTDFRNHRSTTLDLSRGVTAVIGDNGQGKTNLLEAIAWMSRGTSFRGAPVEALVRDGVTAAVIRLEVEKQGRTTLLEAELVVGGRNRLQVNGNRIRRQRDLLGHLRTTVFAPDDLVLVKGGPAARRGYLDDLLVDLHPGNHVIQADLDRILRQRNSLLRQAGGRAAPDVVASLDVWDAKLGEVGEALALARCDLLDEIMPIAGSLLESLTGGGSTIQMAYVRTWVDGGLTTALAEARSDDLRRGTSTVGPHRDEVRLHIDGLPARSHASQGEQRSLVIALRLAGHRVVAARTGSEPVVLLDDVFSELDRRRSASLMSLLSATQTLVTTAADLPESVVTDRFIRIHDGAVVSG